MMVTTAAVARAKVPIAVHADHPAALRPRYVTRGSYDWQRRNARDVAEPGRAWLSGTSRLASRFRVLAMLLASDLPTALRRLASPVP